MAPQSITQVRLLATGDYIVAAEVAVFSFLRSNPWFTGMVRVYTTAKQAAIVEHRFRHLGNVVVISIDQGFVDSIAQTLAMSENPTKWVPERFLTLSLFGDECDGNVLFIDADVLFTGSVEELTHVPGALVAASDAALYLGCQVHRTTNEFIPVGQSTPGQCLPAAFNSGVMRVSPEHLGAHMLAAAHEFLQPDALAALTRRQHDQYVLNRIFDGAWTDCGPTFNYLMMCPHEIFQHSNLRLGDARVVHFNRAPRPWSTQSLDTIDDPLVARAIAMWQRALADMIEDRALRQKLSPS